MKLYLMGLLLVGLFFPQRAMAQTDANMPDLSQMRQYYFVMLTAGPNRTQDSTATAELNRGHLANIMRLSREGKLVLAGPFLDDGPWRGIFILAVDTPQEAEALLRTDPAIAAGRLAYELHPWYGTNKLLEISR